MYDKKSADKSYYHRTKEQRKPTKNREEYVRKVVKYVFGKNFEIKETSSVQ